MNLEGSDCETILKKIPREGKKKISEFFGRSLKFSKPFSDIPGDLLGIFLLEDKIKFYNDFSTWNKIKIGCYIKILKGTNR